MFDIESREVDRDLSTYSAIITALEELSPNACVFCLVHKMDLVQTQFHQEVLQDRSRLITRYSGEFSKSVTTYPTTIWDQSLYKAWGNIVNSLIPNMEVIERYLRHLAWAIQAEEVVLFERTTFLTVKQIQTETSALNPNHDRLERMSNIIKTFKHSLA